MVNDTKSDTKSNKIHQILMYTVKAAAPKSLFHTEVVNRNVT